MQVSSANLSQVANQPTQPAQSRQQVSAEEASESTVQKRTEAVSGDTVKLSLHAQARILRKQGESITQIASQLALDVKTINSYLNPQIPGSQTAFTARSGKTEQIPAVSETPDTTPSPSSSPKSKQPTMP